MKIKKQYTLKQLSNLVRSKAVKDGKIQVLATTSYGYADSYDVVEDICGLTKAQWEECGDSLCDEWKDIKNDWFFCIDGVYYSFNTTIHDVKVVEETPIKIKY